MIHKAAHILGLPEEKITVIEDSKSGISSAIQAGIKDIRLLDSAHLADQVKDIPEILGLPEEKITVIEDSKSGISSAIQAGIKDIRLLDSAHLADQVKDIPEIHQVVMTMDKIKREFFA